MGPATETYVLLRAFADELARCGMHAACTSPGSRSTPLVLSLAREPRLRCYSHLDERCAGFFALGLAKASGVPVAVACTSGTAAAELLPAAVEAREARVPLLLLSADRPAELRDNGAGQAIDQLKLFGSAAKWFVEVAPDGASPQRIRWMRALACRAFWTALEGRPGPVHLNFPLREPLLPEGELPPERGGRADGGPWVRRGAARTSPCAAPGAPDGSSCAAGGAAPGPSHACSDARVLLQAIAGARRGIVVAGRHEREDGLPGAAAGLAEALAWPLLADPLSGARRGAAAIAHYDALLRAEGFAAAHEPDLVLRVGDLPVCKPLRGWLAGLGARQVALDPEGAWQDPAGVVCESLPLAPAAALAGALEMLGARAAGGGAAAGTEPGWLSGWREADERAAEAVDRALEQAGGLSEPATARVLGEELPAAATLFVASSMPVREIETFWGAREEPPRVLCNRGANGIDGTVSSAFGAAAHGRGPVVLLIGDVALAYDLSALIAARRLGLKLTVLLVNNGGGAIFDFLPVSGIAEQDLYERHVATPTGLDFAAAAALYGFSHELAADAAQLRTALGRALAQEGCALIEVRTERRANLALHRRIWAAVQAALQPDSSGSNASSLISVSASSAAGSESRTIPPPA